MKSRRGSHLRAPETARADLEHAGPLRRGPKASKHPVQRLQRLVGNRATRQAMDMALGGRGEPNHLPAALRADIFALSGLDLGGVRVHVDSDRPARIDAWAYAHGDEIYLAPGQQRLLPHEAWHVVQQRQGRVGATGRVADAVINDDPALEAEADRMGARIGKRTGEPIGEAMAELVPMASAIEPAASRTTVATGSVGVVQRARHQGKDEEGDNESVVDELKEVVGSVPLSNFLGAIQKVGPKWKLGTKERTIHVWEIAKEGVDLWDFHLSAMLDDSGRHVQKFHFTLRKGPGKGVDAFAWFKVVGYNAAATLGARMNAGDVGLFSHKTVPDAITAHVKKIDAYAAKLFDLTKSFM